MCSDSDTVRRGGGHVDRLQFTRSVELSALPPSTMPKKRKISCLSGIELVQALDGLKKYRQCIDVTEEGEGEDADAEASISYMKSLDETIARMESRLSGPQVSTLARRHVQELTFFRHSTFPA